MIVRAHDLRVALGGRTILDGASLELFAGETLALLGASGSGKTTLLRCLNRLIEPDRGEVHYEGRAIVEIPAEHLRRRIGYVPQEGGLLPHWTVERNVSLVPRLLSWSPPQRREAARRALERVGLPPHRFAARFPRELSGGERQRAAIARALAAGPSLILLDEPFSAVDAMTRLLLQELFLALREETKLSALLITHDVSEAMRLGNRVGVVDDGRIRQCGTPKEIEARPDPGAVADLLATARRLSAWSR